VKFSCKSRHQKCVERFMELAGQEVPFQPTIPDEKTRLLRSKLILEEALETIEALGFDVIAGYEPEHCCDLQTSLYLTKENMEFEATRSGPDLIEIIDGCCDVIKVTQSLLYSVYNIYGGDNCGKADRSNRENNR
jgi:hypothetical protein